MLNSHNASSNLRIHISIDVLAVEQGLELAVGLDAAILADAEEDEAVDGALDGKIQLMDGECGIAEGQILC